MVPKPNEHTHWQGESQAPDMCNKALISILLRGSPNSIIDILRGFFHDSNLHKKNGIPFPLVLALKNDGKNTIHLFVLKHA